MAKKNGTTKTKRNNQTTSLRRTETERDAENVLTTPFTLMRRFGEEMDRVFGEIGFGRGWMNPVLGAADLAQGLWTPQVEVFERDKEFVIRADLPGLTRDDINVEATDEGITIEGERKQESEEKDGGYYRSERSYGKFVRTFPLPAGVMAEDADASFHDGVLEITLPKSKREPRKPRRVQIHASTGTQAKRHAAGA
jgi:HSP20 family protein